MNQAQTKPRTQDIVVEDVFAHAPEMIWKALTDRLADPPLDDGAKGVRTGGGQPLHLHTKPAALGRTIHARCWSRGKRALAYRWKAGTRNVGYGSR